MRNFLGPKEHDPRYNTDRRGVPLEFGLFGKKTALGSMVHQLHQYPCMGIKLNQQSCNDGTS